MKRYGICIHKSERIVHLLQNLGKTEMSLEACFIFRAHEKTDDCVEYIFRGRSLPEWLRPLYAKLVGLRVKIPYQ